jgi:integrase
VAGLRLESFSLEEGIWTIEERVKTKAPWVAPMHPYARKVLTDWLKARTRGEQIQWRANLNVWVDSKPEVISTAMSRAWREACDRLGYPARLQMRLLRRKYQNMLRRCGVPLEVYMRLCDHSDIQVAYKHYADITFEDQLQSLAKVPYPDNVGVFGKVLPAANACAKVRTNEHTTNKDESPCEDQLEAHQGGEGASEEESQDY